MEKKLWYLRWKNYGSMEKYMVYSSFLLGHTSIMVLVFAVYRFMYRFIKNLEEHSVLISPPSGKSRLKLDKPA